MITPTLLDQRRRSDYQKQAGKLLGDVVNRDNWQRRVDAEDRHKKAGDEPVRSFAMRRGSTSDPDQGLRILERIIKGNDLVPINYLERGVDCARAVCRLRLFNSHRETVGFATGFLVGRGVLMTNHHVLPTAAHAHFAHAEFAYEHDVRGGDRVPAAFALNLRPKPIMRAHLDFCLVGIAPYSLDGQIELAEYGWLTLDGTPGKTRQNEYLTIIQHPAGERKQICVRENKLLEYHEDTLWYQTDTVSGSSGAPVFNNSWQVVALHRSGVPLRDKRGRLLTTDRTLFDPETMQEDQLAWVANEGVRVSSMIACLQEEHSRDELAQRVLEALPPPPLERRLAAATRVGACMTPSSPAAAPDATPPVRAGGRWFEREFDEIKKPPVAKISEYPRRDKDLSSRPGYQTDFLGKGKLLVPFPKIRKDSGAFSFNQPLVWGNGETTLHYQCHSILLSDERRFAIYAIVNVDDNQRYSQPSGGDLKWANDPRLGGVDIGEEFYKADPGVIAVGQPTKRKSPFDRGHQVQQEDATWGNSELSAGRASADTFYFPNAAPQVFDFNQRGNAWQGLEDYVIEVFAADTGLATVITGCVFDAPRASGAFKAGTLGLPLNPKGARSPDPKFLNVRVPKAFYKIVVCNDGHNLRAAAFLMSQQSQLSRLSKSTVIDEEETLTTEQARVFFVTVADVEVLTGLDFGDRVREAQQTQLEAITVGRGTRPGIELRTLADLRL